MSLYDHPEYGHLVTDVVTTTRTMTEQDVQLRLDRSSMFSQDVNFDDVDENLCFLYAMPVDSHESYRPNNIVNGAPTETCRQWKMVYRWMPTERTQKMKDDRIASVFPGKSL
jgi:hypothetical protein